MQAYTLSSLSPTPITNSYSSPNSHNLQSVTMEPQLIDWQLETDYNTITNPNLTHSQHHQHHYHDHVIELQNYQEHEYEDEDGNDLDFTFTCRAPMSSPVSADEIFFNGKIKPLNPNFNPRNQEPQLVNNKTVSIRLPLMRLMSQEEDRDFSFAWTSSSSSSSSCSSSSEAPDDELEGIAPDSYCIWRPPNGKKDSSRRRRKKSDSTGTMSSSSSSSKQWTLRDMLLNTSNSEKGKTSKQF